VTTVRQRQRKAKLRPKHRRQRAPATGSGGMGSAGARRRPTGRVRTQPSLRGPNCSDDSSRSVLGKGSQPIEIIGIIKEFVACPAEPRLSGQVSQDFSRVPVLLRLCGRRQIFDHVDFPQSADQARRTRMRNFSCGYVSDWVEDRRSRRAAHLGGVSGWAAVGPRKAAVP